MKHLFITSADTLSPRWQQAYPDAQIVNINELRLPLPAQGLVWLLLDEENSPAVLSQCVAQKLSVIAMTRNEHPQQARQAIAAGASGYVHYLATASLLQQITQVIVHGGVWLGGDLMRELMLLTKSPQAGMTADTKLQSLTPRERAVAEAVADGKTNKEVAQVLAITERTVKAHLSAVFDKLGVRDRLQLALTVKS
jgi:DNA-binding NarL/FixJ family response regulator